MSRGTCSPYPVGILGAVCAQQLISEESAMASTVDADCPDLVHTCIRHLLRACYTDGPAAAEVRRTYRVDVEGKAVDEDNAVFVHGKDYGKSPKRCSA